MHIPRFEIPDYSNEASWRGQMLAAQISVKQSISELGFLIAGLFLAYLLSAYWPGLAIVVAAAMCAGAIYAVWREARSYVKIHEMLSDESKKVED